MDTTIGSDRNKFDFPAKNIPRPLLSWPTRILLMTPQSMVSMEKESRCPLSNKFPLASNFRTPVFPLSPYISTYTFASVPAFLISPIIFYYFS